MSLFTFGEGYHNYHHKFPYDFRNGISWFAFDPSKWFINILSLFGLTKNLRRTKDYLIFYSKFQSLHNILNKKLEYIDQRKKTYYEEKITILIKTANKIINDWKQSEKLLDKKNELKRYKSELKEIYKDLKKLSKNLNTKKLVLSS